MKKVKMIVLIGLAALGAVYAGTKPKELQTAEQQQKRRLREAMQKSGMEIIEQEHQIKMVATMPKTKDPKKMSREEKNKLLVDVAIGAFNEGDWELMAKLYSKRFVQHNPGKSKPTTWKEFELSCRVVRQTLPTARLEIEDIIAEGDKVAVRCKTVVTYLTGQTWGTETEETIEFTEMDLFRIEGGRIAEEWCEHDTEDWKDKMRTLSRVKAWQ